MMKAKAKTWGNIGKAKAATGGNARKATEYQGHRQEADRKKRQQPARLREDANLGRVGDSARRHKRTDHERLKGKSLFYCESPAERAKEIQRRLVEANREVAAITDPAAQTLFWRKLTPDQQAIILKHQA